MPCVVEDCLPLAADVSRIKQPQDRLKPRCTSITRAIVCLPQSHLKCHWRLPLLAVGASFNATSRVNRWPHVISFICLEWRMVPSKAMCSFVSHHDFKVPADRLQALIVENVDGADLTA